MYSKNADKLPCEKIKSIFKGTSSIVVRLSILHAVASFALLLLATGVLYLVLKDNLEREDKETLLGKFIVLDAALHHKSRGELLKELEWESSFFQPGMSYFRIKDATGRILVQSPGMEDILPASWSPPTMTDPIPVDDLRKRMRLEPLKEKPCLVMARQIKVRDTWEMLDVQMVLDESDDFILMADYRRKLWAVLFLGVFLSIGLGAAIARRGLRPLDEITGAVGKISVTHMHDRVIPARWPKELVALAAAFDAMLDRLEDSFNRLSQFSADLAHELRTPLSNLRGEAEVALSRTRTPNEYRQVLGSSLEELSRLTRLIESLLFLARVENPGTRIECSLLNASEEIKKICDYYRVYAEDRKVELSSSGDGFVIADRILFQRALGNLISNALYHAPSGGKIDVSVQQPDAESIDVIVSDTGSGIDPEHLPHLFNRFFRGDGARDHQGTGLGLSIVKSIMDLHGGTVTIQSEPGAGTTATLRFVSSPSAKQKCLKNSSDPA